MTRVPRTATSWRSFRPAIAAQVIVTATRFLRLGYLWAGLSGFGYDCSGFTHALYASIGVETPRDADAQADAAGNPSYTGAVQTGSAVGTWVRTLAELRPGDLVFFATTSGYIHHVGLYVGLVHGHPTMVDATDTGSFIRENRIDIGRWGKQFAGGGRFLPQ